MKQKGAYCPMCDRRVLATGRAPNHILHFILGLFTFGIWWVFVWLPLLFGTVGNYRCTRCGGRVTSASSSMGRRAGRDDDDDEEDERPRSRRRDNDDEDDRPKRRGKKGDFDFDE